MCGIAGFISKDRGANDDDRSAVLERMCAIIRHRGPDEQGTHVRGRAALGMRRLSVIDLRTGQQPIFNADETLAIVFNGEIYNFKQLRADLQSLGYRFKTGSDTEAILLAYEEWGEDCVERLRGMFAFAIWDLRNEALFIARDRVGKKPLYFSLTASGDFVFGSELKSLLAFGQVDPAVDLSALDAYITFGYVPEEFCIFENVRKLPPGHLLKFRNGKVETRQYWDLRYGTRTDIRSESEYLEALREKLDEAVRIRMISDVPLGAFLSGGVDSSSVVALMSEASSSRVKTFSIGFNEDSFNELKYARVSAQHFGTDHHEFIVTPDLVEVVDDIVWHFDEPFADSSALPTYMVSKLAREFVTVALSGDGGDELFAGYSRYVVDRQRNSFASAAAIAAGPLQRLSAALPHGAAGKNYLYNISLSGIERYIDSISYFNEPRKRLLYSEDFRSRLNSEQGAGERNVKRFSASACTDDPIERLLYVDSKTYLPGDILVKVDRMSMANSLEARAPFLDHELIEFAATIPVNLKLKGGETKYILKKAMEGVVPNEILYRKKQGFGVPIEEWINGKLRGRITAELREKRTLERGYFNKAYIETLMREHSSGRRDHSSALWLLWVLELWHRRFIDNA